MITILTAMIIKMDTINKGDLYVVISKCLSKTANETVSQISIAMKIITYLDILKASPFMVVISLKLMLVVFSAAGDDLFESSFFPLYMLLVL